MLQLLDDPLQLIPLGGMHVLALLHHVPGQLGHVCGRLEVLAELDPLPLPLLRVAKDRWGDQFQSDSVIIKMPYVSFEPRN